MSMQCAQFFLVHKKYKEAFFQHSMKLLEKREVLRAPSVVPFSPMRTLYVATSLQTSVAHGGKNGIEAGVQKQCNLLMHQRRRLPALALAGVTYICAKSRRVQG